MSFLHSQCASGLWERPQHGIMFQQVEVSFGVPKEKWMLEPAWGHNTLSANICWHKDSRVLAEIMVEVGGDPLPCCWAILSPRSHWNGLTKPIQITFENLRAN